MQWTDEDILELAEQRIYRSGIDDTAERLCALNMTFGLAKIMHFQISRGWQPDATFIAAPDATVTRNHNRWLQGMGYGGKLQWSGPFWVLDIKPNGCGVVMGRLAEIPARDVVLERLHRAQHETLRIDGTPLRWDLSKGNHFLEVYRPRSKGWKPAWRDPVFILHASGREHRAENPDGPGLYWDKSQVLPEWWQLHQTPWGTLHVLTDKPFQQYVAHCRRVHAFQIKRRAAMAQRLLGEIEVLFNGTHQGLLDANSAVLGCYTFGEKAAPHILYSSTPQPLFPLTLRRELPTYLLQARPNFSTRTIETLGWKTRTTEPKIFSQLTTANILPHGGGTAYPELHNPRVEQKADHRLYTVDGPQGSLRFRSPRELSFSYRGQRVLEQTLACEMAEVAGELEMVWHIGGEA